MLNLIFIFRKFLNIDFDLGEIMVVYNIWKDVIKVCDKYFWYMY